MANRERFSILAVKSLKILDRSHHRRLSIPVQQIQLGTRCRGGRNQVRLIKMFGLAALAAVAAMAFIGASSASAKTTTQLCKVHTALTCPAGEGSTSVHLVNEGIGTLLSDLVDVLCLTTLGNAEPLALAKPQIAHGSGLVFQNCGTTSTHSNCVITVLEQPLFNVLKTGLDKGTLIGQNGQTRVRCDNIFGFIDINCVYDATGLEFKAENQKIVANETPVSVIEDSGLCPEESFLDGTVVPLVSAYLLQ